MIVYLWVGTLAVAGAIGWFATDWYHDAKLARVVAAHEKKEAETQQAILQTFRSREIIEQNAAQFARDLIAQTAGAIGALGEKAKNANANLGGLDCHIPGRVLAESNDLASAAKAEIDAAYGASRGVSAPATGRLPRAARGERE